MANKSTNTPLGNPQSLCVPPDGKAPSPRFETTRWQLVLAAGRTGSPGPLDALEQLCQVYWYPVYVEVRRRHPQPADALDLTQGFFERLLSGTFLAVADPQKGRFRSYLLTALNHFLIDTAKRANSLRRGGGIAPVALDGLDAEERYRLEPPDVGSPAVQYERRFALALLQQVLHRLEREFSVFGSPVLFRRLQDYLAEEDPEGPSYAELGAELGMSIDALKSAMYRLRRRYREVLRDEIKQVVSSPEEVEEEIRHLFRVLGG